MAAAAAPSSSLPLSTSITPCRGYDDWSHRVFLVTNDTRTAKTLETMRTQTVVGTAMLGVSGFFTLNMAAGRGTRAASTKQIEHVVIFDRSIRVEQFWKQMKEIMSSSPTRVEAIEKIQQLIIANKDRFFLCESGQFTAIEAAEQYLKELEQEIQNGESWLSNDIKFATIKKIFDQGNFEFLRLDLTDPTGFEALQKQFIEREIGVDTIYLSNTVEYMDKPSEIEACIRSMDGLIQPETLVIDTAPRKCTTCAPLVQRVRRRNESPVGDLFELPPPESCEIHPKPKLILMTAAEFFKVFGQSQRSDGG